MNKLINNLRIFLILLFPIFFYAVPEAQAPKGKIHGYVLNDEGQVIPQASVLLINKKTSLRKNTISNAQGLFQFSELAIGTYQLEGSSEGYLSEVREEVQLTLTTSIEIEIRLQKKQTSLRDAEERGVGMKFSICMFNCSNIVLIVLM